MTLSRSTRRAKPRWFVLLIALAALLLVLAASVLAVHENTALELDGNTVNDAVAGDDWNNLDDGLGDPGSDDGALISGFQHDEAQPDVSHHEPSNKDDQGVEDWGCVRKMNVSNKDDLRHAYAAAYDIGGDLHLFFGADRDTNNGSANIAAWFFQTPVSCVVGPGPQFADGAFAGHKTDGDLFIVSEFTNGGRVSGVNIYIWTDPTPLVPESGDECLGDGVDCSTAHSGQDHPAFTGIDCQVTNPHANPGSPNVCATVNGDGDGKHEASDAINVPWETTEDPESAEFFEGGLNLDALFPTGLDCFSQVMIETRSSFEFNANLFDISFLDFDTCGDITAHKYLDVDGNGQDDGEPALEGWTINLYASDGTTLLDSGSTDSDGDVLFADLSAGTYVVCEELISDTPPWINTDPAGVTLCETVVLGALGNEVADFGNGQPDIEVTKAADITQVCAGANTLVTYTYHVINAGTVELTGVTVSDDTIAGAQAAFELANGDSDTLAVGADVTFTLTATINATTENEVTASGTYGPATPADTDTDTALVTAFDCDIEVTKTADITEVCIGADTLVTYTVTVSNAGNVELTNVDVVDDNGTPLNTADDVAVFTDQTLAPAGETGDELSTTFSRTINATTTNTVTATGDALGNSPADTDTDTALVTAFDCDIEVTKTADITEVCIGADTLVTYTVTVSNAGNVELTNVDVVDDNGTPLNTADDVAVFTDQTLAPAGETGDELSTTFSRTINATTTNTVTATGDALGNSPADTDTDTALVTAFDCDIEVTKTADITEVCIGADTLVTYTVTVSNAGNVELTNVDVVDDNGTPLNTADDVAVFTDQTLAPAGETGDELSTTFSRTINATTTNTVTATGDALGNSPADTDTDTALVTAFDCDIEVTKTADITEVCIGADTLVTYTVTVSNAGNVELTNVDVVDDNGTPLNTADDVAVFTDQTLAPAGETGDELSTTFSRTINATTTNTVTATGDALGNSPADTDTDTALVTAFDCDIEVTKTADITEVCIGADTLVTYTVTVSNAGNVELTNVDVVDDNGTPLNTADDVAVFTDQTLAPAGETGDELSTTFSRTINATTTNTVTATGDALGNSPADTDTDTALVTAFDCDIEVTKTADITEVCIGADTLVTYTVTVSNAGNVELTNVDVVDDNGTPLNTADDVAVFTDQTLAPAGETGDELSTTFSRTINATTTNTVTATGDALGNSPADTDTDTALVTAFDCDIEVTKTADITEVCIGADTLVTYTVTVSNAGNVELTNVDVVDDNGTPLNTADDVAVFTDQTLAPAGETGDELSTTFSRTINATTTNTVTATGDALGNSPADTDTDTALVTAFDCGGNLFHTGTTCQQFLGIDPPSGLAGEEITEILYGVKQNKINNTAPGVFFYYTLIEAPNTAPAAFTVDIVQTETHATFSTLFGVQQENQIRLFDGDCSTPEVQFSISDGGGQAHVTITGASPGQTFVISVKYDTATVKGQNAPNPTTVHYDFRTEIGGLIVDEDEDGLNLAKKT